MMRVALALVFAFAVHPATYAAVILIDDDRSVRSSGSVASTTSSESWIVEERSPGNFGVFDFDVDETRTAGANSASASASMSSSISDTRFSASAWTASEVQFNEATSNFARLDSNASAEFEVTFDVFEDTLFDLDAFLSLDRMQGFSGGTSILSLFSSSSSGGEFRLSFGGSPSAGFEQNVAISGVLTPNRYTLRALANNSSDAFNVGMIESATAGFDVNLRLRAVPVPAAVWLFVSGLITLLGLRRRGATR
jgi:hypothetical protein